MSGVNGNENLAWMRGTQFLTIDGTSDAVELPTNVQAVDLYSDVVCWIQVSDPGKTPTVAAPSGEKVEIAGFFLPADIIYSIPVPEATDAAAVKIVAIQASGAGTLYINYRSFV